MMIRPIFKRALIIISVFGALFLMIRYLFHDRSLTSVQQNYQRPPGAPVFVTVFYEALCTDSKHFILKQLAPAYKEAAPIMDVRLIPYGNAETFTNPDGTYRFNCQHGPTECQANIYHACTISIITDAKLRLDVVACMIRDNRLPKEALHRCAKQHSVDNIDLIQKCYDSSHGSELLKLNGEVTHALRPGITFIPTITLDGSQGNQAKILKDLLGEVCKVAGNTEETEKICNK